MTAAVSTRTPRKSIQIVVWLFAALAVLGVGMLASAGTPTSSMDLAGSTATTPPPASSTSIDYGTVAAPAPADTGGSSNVCEDISGNTSLLPAMRWESFSLASQEYGFFNPFGPILSGFATIAFTVGNLIWKILFFFIDFGVSFNPLCNTATMINDLVADLGMFTAWFAIPLFIFWLVMNIKKMARRRTGRLIGSFVMLAAYVGAIFYITDRAETVKGQDSQVVLTTTGTVPWMANSLMNTFSTMYSSLNSVTGLLTGDSEQEAASAFYDGDSGNAYSCYAFDQGLYTQYEASMTDAGKNAPQTTTMKQMSGIWEQAFLSNWIRAQFGQGDEANYFPSQAACRMLEATVDIPMSTKARQFAVAHGADDGDGTGSNFLPTNDGDGLVHMMQPMGDAYQLPVATSWATCQFRDGSWQMTPGVELVNKPDRILCSGKQDGFPMANTGFDKTYDELLKHLGKEGTILYLSGGQGDIESQVGNEPSDTDSENSAMFYNFRDFTSASVGSTMSIDRLTQGVISLVIAVIYLWSFGPVALGLTVVGFALIILIGLLPLTLALCALGIRTGPKILKMTAASTAVLFIFGVIMTLLSVFITIVTSLVNNLVSGNGFGTQVAMASAPVIAVLLLKKLFQSAGLGNITSLSGALGMTSAMAAKAAGSPRAGDGVSRAANRGLGSAARGLGAVAGMRRGGVSPLQRLAEGRMGKSAVGRKALGAMSNAAAAARKTGGALGALGKDGAQSAGEAFGTTGLGKKLKSAKENFPKTGAGRLLKTAADGLAKNKAARYGTALTGAAGVGALAGGAGLAATGLLPAALVAAGAVPLARRVGKKVGDNKAAKLDGKIGEDGLSLKDDQGNDLLSPRQLAYARSRGLMQKADVANARIASRALKTMTPEERALYSSEFERAQIAGMPLSEAHKEAQKQALGARQYIAKLGTPEERTAALQAYTGGALDSVRARQNGGASPDGSHPGFAGYDNEVARQMGLQALSTQMGVEGSKLVLGNHGIAVPAPNVAQDRLPNGAPNLGENVTLDFAGHPALYLDRETVKRTPQETDEQYSARITASMTARGLVHESGEVVDVFAQHGIDTKTPAGEARVTKWLEGGRDETLSSITYTKARGEDAIVKAATKWTNDNTVDHAERQWKYMVSAVNTQNMALSDTVDISSIPVAVDASKLDFSDRAIPAVFGTNTPLKVTAEAGEVAVPRVQLQATPLSAPGTAGESGAPVHKLDMNPETVQVTLGDTLTRLNERTGDIGTSIASIYNKNSEVPELERMRTAARDLQQVQGVEREVEQILEGLRAASFARSALEVDKFAASNPQMVTHAELRSRSQRALQQVQAENEEREGILSRKLSGLFKATSVAQNSDDIELRRKAFRETELAVSDIQETIEALYEEEARAAKEVNAEAQAALSQFRETIEAAGGAYNAPSRSVVSSKSQIEENFNRRRAYADGGQ